ncbi:PREDICTED: GDSL esterase/lipase At2g03980-like, partial [Lupinus angustifolius]|uniref:GDSL esterase/lipase At2g03980-like n=1 Tax=Lupinus angustifolius TaxID=3871 RepID=UPI00092E6139
MESSKAFWIFSFIVHHAFFVKVDGSKSLVPALYVFGDSSIDAGNNNNLITHAKSNVPPYGIDFNNNATERFTNGKTFADLIAIKLGLPLQPPYLGIHESKRYQVITGINYASAPEIRTYKNMNPEEFADYLLEQLSSKIK